MFGLTKWMVAGVLLGGVLGAFAAEPREWTSADGRKVMAVFGGVKDGEVLLTLKDGKVVGYPLAELSKADQAYVEKTKGKYVSPVLTTPRVPLERRVWPTTVKVSSRSIDIRPVKESVEERDFVYESEAFEFTSQAKLAGSVMKEVARTFEATRALVSELPWGIVCVPPNGRERYRAALYETRADYFKAGGPTNSGGVYMSGEEIFKVPFGSLGLVMRGKTYFMRDGYSNDTLVHELTHQMMHDYLPFLPKWIIEGSAEYTELLPYNAGTFRASSHKPAIKKHIDRRGGASGVDLGSLETHLKMDRSGWNSVSEQRGGQMRVYFRSLMMVYYFCHLDGDGKGTRFIKYMDAVRDEAEARIRFFADPRVKRFPGGRYSWSGGIKPPDMNPKTAPFKHLGILLDGRSYEELAVEVEAGFKSIGEKVTAQ